MTKKQTKLAILGFGRMGDALAMGLVKRGIFTKDEIICTVGHKPSEERILNRGFKVGASNVEAASAADIVLIATKPVTTHGVLNDIKEVMESSKLLISIAAGISIEEMESVLGPSVPVIRSMPNTPALVGEGITVYCGGAHASSSHMQQAKEIFDAVGTSVELDEGLMDAATGLSGCGPAYVYLMIEALTEAGVKVGISRDISSKLVVHTLRGAASLLLSNNKHPALLKDDVTTPAGCAIDGLLELEKGGVRMSLINAVVEATKRAHKLGNGKK